MWRFFFDFSVFCLLSTINSRSLGGTNKTIFQRRNTGLFCGVRVWHYIRHDICDTCVAHCVVCVSPPTSQPSDKDGIEQSYTGALPRPQVLLSVDARTLRSENHTDTHESTFSPLQILQQTIIPPKWMETNRRRLPLSSHVNGGHFTGVSGVAPMNTFDAEEVANRHNRVVCTQRLHLRAHWERNSRWRVCRPFSHIRVSWVLLAFVLTATDKGLLQFQKSGACLYRQSEHCLPPTNPCLSHSLFSLDSGFSPCSLLTRAAVFVYLSASVCEFVSIFVWFPVSPFA